MEDQISEPEYLPTRYSLLSRIKDFDDHASWKVFFDTYWKLIYSTARNSGLSEVESSEVVQETVIAVFKQIPEFKYDSKRGSFKSWLKTLTHWRIKDQLRKRKALKSEQRFVPLSEDGNGSDIIQRIGRDAELEAIWDQEWERNLMDAALQRIKNKVDPNHYQIFELYCIKGWPALKVSKFLNIGITKVYMVKHRVQRVVQEEICKIRDHIL